MTDAIFQPNPPPEPETSGPPSRRQSGKKKGGRPKGSGKPKLAVVESGQSALPRRKARSVKIDLSVAMSALSGLTEDDSKFLTGVIQAMQAFSAAQRRRIVGALGKVFV